ncbi:MAG: type II secretion system F family protein [Gemmataceae bacterium]
MLFASKLPPAALVQWSRALKHGADIGISPVKTFRQQAKSGPAVGRTLASDVADRLARGDTLEDALEPDRDRFPILFTELTAVGEQAGRLTETFGELEHYYEAVVSARKQLYAALTWPAIQYVGAILTIFLMLLVLGLLGGRDPLGLGLASTSGAFAFLLVMTLFTVAMVWGFYICRENEGLRSKAEAFVLKIPVLGTCFRTFALQRFALAMYMTFEAGLRADKALLLAFRATANDAYRNSAERVAKQVRGGSDVHSSLAGCGRHLFPDDFLDAVQVGEVSGQLTEVMRKQSDRYRDEATRQLKTLTSFAGGAVYALVGLMLVVLIFKMAMTVYVNPLNDAMKAADNPQEWLRAGGR